MQIHRATLPQQNPNTSADLIQWHITGCKGAGMLSNLSNMKKAVALFERIKTWNFNGNLHVNVLNY
jgi:hypothetical protein